MNQILLQYTYLQLLDFLTTVAFLLNGVREANPFVRWAIGLTESPLSGLILVKILALVLGFVCWRAGRGRLLARINLLFALVIAWNLVAIIAHTLA